MYYRQRGECMSYIMSRRHLWLIFLPALALLFGFGLSGGASANPDPVATAPNAAPDSPSAPSAADAYVELRPRAGAPSNGGTVSPGTKFTLDLILHAGSNNNLTVQQSYLTFNNAVLQVVDPNGTTCNPVNTVTSDTTVFDAALQNEVCN